MFGNRALRRIFEPVREDERRTGNPSHPEAP
jgi:hypothetical protein